MRGGSVGSRILWLLSVGLSASCAQIIGLSDYEIVTEPTPGDGGTGNDAGGASSASAGQLGDAGEPASGGAGASGGNAGAGQAGEPTQAGGAGGEGPAGCVPADCDDEIDCTNDTCDENNECVHTPDTSLCDVDDDECIVCRVGLGCVPGELTPRELLVDPLLDEQSDAWVQDVRYTTLQSTIISFDDYADSGDYSAWFLGVEETGTEQAYFDLYQSVTIPADARGLRLTGTYELLNGTVQPADDFLSASLFDGDEEVLEFHQWLGEDAEAVPWVPFEYAADEAELPALRGLELTFDIIGYSWDTAFYFDTLSLEATVCE